jgi:hypothetical protein
MKHTRLAIASLVIFAMTACNNEKNETTTVSTSSDSVTTPVKQVAAASQTDGKVVKIETTRVPDTVRTSFEKKYPKALEPQWVEYTPVESDGLPMDDTYYYVTFLNNGEDITAWYNNRNEWVKTSTRIKGDSRLPDAVNKTLNDQYPGFKIEEISKENDKNMEMFEIKLNKGEEKAKLKILPNGEVFKRKS